MNINNVIKSAFENYQAGNLQQAVNICLKIVRIHPSNINAVNLLGIMSYQQKDYESAIKYTKRLITLDPSNAQAYYMLGHSSQERGQLEQAIAYYQKSLELNPNFVDAYYNLGAIFQDKKQNDEAISCYQKALQINPTDVDAYYNLGRVLQEKGQVDEAIACYQKALQLNPDLPDAYNNLGAALQEKGQVDEAIVCCQKALQLNPDLPDAYNNLGAALREKGQVDEAIACYQKALQLNPDLPDAYNNLGDAIQTKGQVDEAVACFRKALQLKPDSAGVLVNLVRSERLSYNNSKELFKLVKKLNKHDMSENDSIKVYFAMGKLCDNLNMFKESFEYYRFGNALKRTQVEFNIDSQVDYLSRIRKTFSADFIEHRKSWGSNSEMPIFIFGMPRSGTTLVEQIIASHPDVYGGGELQFFIQMEQKLPSILKVDELYPECLNFIDDKTAYDMAELYIKGTREIAGLSKDFTRITDKNPFNFHHLGLISLLFPKASFIHCQRHPLDTCISIYFQNFATGNHFAYDLSELGQYYREYLRLMNHWRTVLPIRIFELKYEDIVQQQEKISRKLVEFCGIEWDPACLDFYKNDRPVLTASSWQVHQPIYTTSCGRWKNYEQFLDTLKEVLADFI
jgi:tetratricopeptide (TPR) repeat protein